MTTPARRGDPHGFRADGAEVDGRVDVSGGDHDGPLALDEGGQQLGVLLDVDDLLEVRARRAVLVDPLQRLQQRRLGAVQGFGGEGVKIGQQARADDDHGERADERDHHGQADTHRAPEGEDAGHNAQGSHTRSASRSDLRRGRDPDPAALRITARGEAWAHERAVTGRVGRRAPNARRAPARRHARARGARGRRCAASAGRDRRADRRLSPAAPGEHGRAAADGGGWLDRGGEVDAGQQPGGRAGQPGRCPEAHHAIAGARVPSRRQRAGSRTTASCPA